MMNLGELQVKSRNFARHPHFLLNFLFPAVGIYKFLPDQHCGSNTCFPSKENLLKQKEESCFKKKQNSYPKVFYLIHFPKKNIWKVQFQPWSSTPFLSCLIVFKKKTSSASVTRSKIQRTKLPIKRKFTKV